MRFKTTWILLLMVVLVGATLWILEGREAYESCRRHEGARAFRIHPERITELVLEQGDTRIVCALADGVWRIVEPVNAQADAGEMDRILSLLRELTRGEIITPRDRRELGLTLRDYGLERPRARLALKENGAEQVWYVGRESPLGDSVYVLPADSDDLVMVSSRLMRVWPETLDQLRDRMIFHGDPRRAYRFEIRRPGGFLQVVRADDGTWRIQQPVIAPADRAAVRQWIDRAFEWRVMDFVSDSISDAAIYGLDESAAQVTLWTDGHESGQTLLLGAVREGRTNEVYARSRGGQTVFSVLVDALSDSVIRPNDLRDRSLVPMRKQDIDTVHITRGAYALTLQRQQADRWEVMDPKRWAADAEVINELLDAWTSARILQFADDTLTNGASQYGFTDDALKIVFESHTQPVPGSPTNGYTAGVAIRVSNTTPDDDAFWARRGDEPHLYVIPQDVREVTSWNPLFYRSRSVIDVRPDAVRQVRVQTGGKEHVAERTASGDWAWTSTVPVAARAPRLSQIVGQLTQLRAETYLADDPRDWSPYGLDVPTRTWALGLTPEAGMGRVLLMGDILPDGRAYARTLGQEVVFLLSAETTTLLMADLFETAAPPAQDEGE